MAAYIKRHRQLAIVNTPLVDAYCTFNIGIAYMIIFFSWKKILEVLNVNRFADK